MLKTDDKCIPVIISKKFLWLFICNSNEIFGCFIIVHEIWIYHNTQGRNMDLPEIKQQSKQRISQGEMAPKKAMVDALTPLLNRHSWLQLEKIINGDFYANFSDQRRTI